MLRAVIALALDASRSARDHGHGDTGGQLFFMATGIVSMTLLLNHTWAGRLMIRLKLTEDPLAPMSVQKRMILLHIKQYMQETVQKELLGLERELGKQLVERFFALLQFAYLYFVFLFSLPFCTIQSGDYDEEEVARLCSLQHSEYGVVHRSSFDINASELQQRKERRSNDGTDLLNPAGRTRASSAASSDFGGTLSLAARSSSKAVSEKGHIYQIDVFIRQCLLLSSNCRRTF